MKFLDRLKPGVQRDHLYFGACIMWGIAGGVLCYRGALVLVLGEMPALVFVGLGAGVTFYHTMFFRIPRRHISRIEHIPHQVPCAFSFLDWNGYGVMALMISIGVSLRLLNIIPESVLGTLSTAMGVALLVSAGAFAKAGLARRRLR